MNSATEITNAMLHITILWTVLLCFYKFYISKVETQAFAAQFQSMIDKNVNLSFDIKTKIQSVNQAYPSMFSGLQTEWSKPDGTVVTNNTWLFRVGFTALAGLVVLLVSSILENRHYAPLAHLAPVGVGNLLTVNLLTFAFVGVVEYIFFTQVISKYVPAPPSLLVTSALKAAES